MPALVYQHYLAFNGQRSPYNTYAGGPLPQAPWPSPPFVNDPNSLVQHSRVIAGAVWPPVQHLPFLGLSSGYRPTASVEWFLVSPPPSFLIPGIGYIEEVSGSTLEQGLSPLSPSGLSAATDSSSGTDATGSRSVTTPEPTVLLREVAHMEGPFLIKEETAATVAPSTPDEIHSASPPPEQDHDVEASLHETAQSVFAYIGID